MHVLCLQAEASATLAKRSQGTLVGCQAHVDVGTRLYGQRHHQQSRRPRTSVVHSKGMHELGLQAGATREAREARAGHASWSPTARVGALTEVE